MADGSTVGEGTTAIDLECTLHENCRVTGTRFQSGVYLLRCENGAKTPELLEALNGTLAGHSAGVAAPGNGFPQADNASPDSDPFPTPNGRTSGSTPPSSSGRALQPRHDDDILRRVPPQNIEAEQSVLGAVLLENEALSTARSIVSANDFYRETHRIIFRAMSDLAGKGRPIDAITLSALLKQRHELEQIGGPGYIAELADAVPTTAHTKHYSEIVRDMAIKRKIAVEASEIASMAYDGVSADALMGEAQRRLAIVDRDANMPTVLKMESYADAIAANEEYLRREPVVESLLYSSAVSMITGGKHAGKSTLARWLAICVAKGWDFLGRSVQESPVLYIASEDETMAARMELANLGWKQGDPMFFFTAANLPDDPSDFHRMLIKEIVTRKIKLVIVDMLFDFIHVADEMGYAETRRAVGEIQDIATASVCHICAIHHAPKNAAIGDAAVAALGSQGLAARVSPIMLVRRFGPGVHSLISTDIRDPRGKGFGESRLIKNPDGSVEIGGPFKVYMLGEVYASRVLEMMTEDAGAEFTAPNLVEQLGLTYEVARATLSNLYKNHLIERTGTGKRGKPYRYYVSDPNTPKTESITPQEGRNVGKTEDGRMWVEGQPKLPFENKENLSASEAPVSGASEPFESSPEGYEPEDNPQWGVPEPEET